MPFRSGGGEQLVPLICLAACAAIAVPQVLEFRRQAKARDCLVRIATGAGDPACPFTGKPYAAGISGCPDPGGHLPTNPRYAKGRFEQDLPADPGGADFPIASLHLKARLETPPSGPVLVVEPRAWWKYLGGPALQLLGIWLVFLVVRGVVRMRRAGKATGGVLAWAAILVALLLLPTGLVVASIWGRQTFAFDRGHRELRHETTVAGVRPWGATVHADPRALAPVGKKGAVFLVGADGKATHLFRVDPTRLGALAPLHAALFPRD